MLRVTPAPGPGRSLSWAPDGPVCRQIRLGPPTRAAASCWPACSRGAQSEAARTATNSRAAGTRNTNNGPNKGASLCLSARGSARGAPTNQAIRGGASSAPSGRHMRAPVCPAHRKMCPLVVVAGAPEQPASPPTGRLIAAGPSLSAPSARPAPARRRSKLTPHLASLLTRRQASAAATSRLQVRAC